MPRGNHCLTTYFVYTNWMQNASIVSAEFCSRRPSKNGFSFVLSYHNLRTSCRFARFTVTPIGVQGVDSIGFVEGSSFLLYRFELLLFRFVFFLLAASNIVSSIFRLLYSIRIQTNPPRNIHIKFIPVLIVSQCSVATGMG